MKKCNALLYLLKKFVTHSITEKLFLIRIRCFEELIALKTGRKSAAEIQLAVSQLLFACPFACPLVAFENPTVAV